MKTHRLLLVAGLSAGLLLALSIAVAGARASAPAGVQAAPPAAPLRGGSVTFYPHRNGQATPGSTLVYTHTLANTGAETDTFDLALSSGWGTLLSSSPVTLAPGTGTTVAVSVSIPMGSGGLTDVTRITATSQLSPSVSAAVIDTTTADHLPDLAFAPDRAGSGSPGDVVTYTHTLTNTGNGPDSFTLSHSSGRGWPVDYATPVQVGYGESATVVVSVTLPLGSGGLTDVTTLTATSQASSTVQAAVFVSTTVDHAPGLAFMPDHDAAVDPGQAITYTHRLTNTGNGPDSFSLAMAGSQTGWSALLTPGPFDLEAGQGADVRLRVQPPIGSGGLVGTTVLTATSAAGAGPACVTDVTSSTFSAGLAFAPDRDGNIYPGSAITYTHRLTNTGNGADTYQLTLHSSPAWAALLDPGPFDLAAGQSVGVRVRVQAPAGSGGLTSTAVLTATSQGGAPMRSVQDTTTAIFQPGVRFGSSENRVAPSGAAVVHTHLLTNTGNGRDTFVITYTSSQPAWTRLLDPGPFTLAAGQTTTVRLEVTLPNPALYLSDTTVLTITSEGGAGPASVVDVTAGARYDVYLPLAAYGYPPAWRQAEGSAGIDFYDVSVCPSDPRLQYAGTTGQGVYHSTDGGETWQSWALSDWATPVVVNPIDCSQAFAAVWGVGIYRINGQGNAQLISTGPQGLDEQRVYGLTISPDGQTLYAGTDTQGVYRTSTTNIAWQAINQGITDLRIRSLYLIDGTLYAGSRQCSFYSSTNGGSSWQTSTILAGGETGACEDAQVWAIAEMGSALYASLGLDKGLYYRTGSGAWTRLAEIPDVTIFRFGLLPYASRLYVGTYGNGVYTCAEDNHCRPLGNGGLGSNDVRGLNLAQLSGEIPRLVAGTGNGVWWVQLAP